MPVGKLYVYNQKVDHKILAQAIQEKREHLICVLNTHITLFPLTKFMAGEFAKKYDTYVTKQDAFLVINFYNKKSLAFENRIVLKSREIGCENEFKLRCLDYYTTLQETINEQTDI